MAQFLLTTSAQNNGTTPGANNNSVNSSPNLFDDSLLRMKPPFVKLRIGELE